MTIIRFVEKANVLVRYMDYKQFTVMEHHFAVGHVYQAHVIADQAIEALWGKVVDENVKRVNEGATY